MDWAFLVYLLLVKQWIMAKKQKKETKEKAIEVMLWEAANKLRGSVEPTKTQKERKPQANRTESVVAF